MDVATREPWLTVADETVTVRRDHRSFDISCTAEPLEHLGPMVPRVFAQAKSL